MLKNLKIGKRLIISFMIVAALASLAGVISTVLMQRIRIQYDYAMSEYGFAQGDIGKAMVIMAESTRYVRDVVCMNDPERIAEANQALDEKVQQFGEYLAVVEKRLDTEEEEEIYGHLKENIAIYKQNRKEIVALASTGKAEDRIKAQEKLTDELDPIYDNMYNSFKELLELNVNNGNLLDEQLTRLGNISTIFSISAIIIAFILSVILGGAISRSIANPVQLCAQRLRNLAKGDVSSPVPEVANRDEIGILAEATQEIVGDLQKMIADINYILKEMSLGNFNIDTKDANVYVGDFKPLLESIHYIISTMNQTLSKINESSDQVSLSADQMSGSAQALSQGAAEQASSVEELAATISDISQQIGSNAEHASSASQKADEVGLRMHESNDQMRKMMDAMQEINTSSKEISKIIKAIEDIAFQTNILALNAAVEAARAGVAGKGFAVVADEVRNLASKSAQASNNTAALIEESIAAVENGAKIAEETAQSMNTAVEGMREVTTTVNKITQASREQAEAADQIAQGVEQISAVIQTNSATAEESAAASEELSGQAQMLKELVNQFKLKKESYVGAAYTYQAPSFEYEFSREDQGTKY